MKKMRKFLAMLTVLAMMLSLLTACGKSPTDSFFDLYEEVSQIKDRDFELSASVKGDDVTIKLSMEGSAYQSQNQAKMTGSASVKYSGVNVSVDIPEILMDDDTIYINTQGVCDLVQTFLQQDISDYIDGEYIELEIEGDGNITEASEKLTRLFSETVKKIKEDVATREGAVVDNKDGSYTLTLSGEELLDLSKIVLKDVVERRDDYMDVLLDLYPENEMMDKDSLEEMFDDLENGIEDLEGELNDEALEELENMSISITLGKTKSGTYTMSENIKYDGEESISMKISGEVKPIRGAESFRAPRDTVSLDDLTESLGLTGFDDYDFDDYDDFDNFGDDTGDDFTDPELPEYMTNVTRVGNDTLGYVDVPAEFVTFQEADGISGVVDSLQYSDPSEKSIFTLVAYENTDADTVAGVLAGSFDEDTDAEDVTTATVSIGQYEAKQIYAYYPDENLFLVIWVFDTPDHDDLTHFLSIEFDSDEYLYLFMLADSFSFDETSSGFTGSTEDSEDEQGSVEGLNLTKVNDDISEITCVTYDGGKVTFPVLNDADFDNAYIAEDYTYVTVESGEGGWYMNYSSSLAEWFDLEERITGYADIFSSDDSPMQVTDQVKSADGKVTAQAFYGDRYGDTMGDVLIAVECGEYVAVLDYTIYDCSSVSLQPVFDYFGIDNILAEVNNAA